MYGGQEKRVHARRERDEHLLMLTEELRAVKAAIVRECAESTHDTMVEYMGQNGATHKRDHQVWHYMLKWLLALVILGVIICTAEVATLLVILWKVRLWR